MLQIYSQERVRQCLLSGYKELEIVEYLTTGDKEMSFQYPVKGPHAQHLQPEAYVITKDDEYVLKEVANSKGWAKYRAILNLEGLTGKSYPSFETVEMTMADCLGQALLGTGWTVGVCESTKKRTIRKDSECTTLDVITQCVSTYKVEVKFDTKHKVVNAYERVGRDRGAYFMEAVNLRKPPTFSHSTNQFYTQIRPIGKDGLRINVNGKDYLENHSYSPKNIMLTWKDERYTKVESLIEDANLKLAEICRPADTYEADVIDLANLSPGYDILAYEIGDTVTLVSKTSGVKEKTRIVQLTRYPHNKKKNKCQLSTAKKTFAEMQEEVIAEAVAEATGAAAANTSEQIATESGIQSEEVRLLLEGQKTEILQDVSDGYVAKTDLAGVKTDVTTAAVTEVKKYTDKQLESYATQKQLTDEVAAAKKTVEQDVEALRLETAEDLAAVEQAAQQAVEDLRLASEEERARLEETKNDITADDGTVWRMGISGGLLYFEKMEG